MDVFSPRRQAYQSNTIWTRIQKNRLQIMSFVCLRARRVTPVSPGSLASSDTYFMGLLLGFEERK